MNFLFFLLVQVGIEPWTSTWKAGAIQLSYSQSQLCSIYTVTDDIMQVSSWIFYLKRVRCRGWYMECRTCNPIGNKFITFMGNTGYYYHRITSFFVLPFCIYSYIRISGLLYCIHTETLMVSCILRKATRSWGSYNLHNMPSKVQGHCPYLPD